MREYKWESSAGRKTAKVTHILKGTTIGIHRRQEIEMYTCASVNTKENAPQAGIAWIFMVPLKGMQRKMYRRPVK